MSAVRSVHCVAPRHLCRITYTSYCDVMGSTDVLVSMFMTWCSVWTHLTLRSLINTRFLCFFTPLPPTAVKNQLLQQQWLPLVSSVTLRHLQGVQDARTNREWVHHRPAATALLHGVQRALRQQALRDVVPLWKGAAQRQGKHALMFQNVVCGPDITLHCTPYLTPGTY